MSILVVQLNHPGSEKPFKLGKGYREDNNRLIREWNNDASHYRKFICQQGKYLSKNELVSKSEDLLFWGEWEGNSWFHPFTSINPNGIHRPFHANHIRGHQNTDPYVFGKRFYYAVCKQRGQLTQLDAGSVVLFGSSFKAGFALDTVFVVDSHETAHQVATSGGMNYSDIYREATLEQLSDFYSNPVPNSPIKLYSGKMFSGGHQPFCYVPCKPNNAENAGGFKRVMFSYAALNGLQLSSNPTGIKIIGSGNELARKIWKIVTNEVIRQGFCLAVELNEPS